MADEILQKSTELKKSFHYGKGTVNLDFTLSMENSKQLREFLSCLSAAKEDIENILKEMKN